MAYVIQTYWFLFIKHVAAFVATIVAAVVAAVVIAVSATARSENSVFSTSYYYWN
jgi:ABC-type proline/glycine betaine transport system permease subunit